MFLRTCRISRLGWSQKSISHRNAMFQEFFYLVQQALNGAHTLEPESLTRGELVGCLRLKGAFTELVLCIAKNILNMVMAPFQGSLLKNMYTYICSRLS